jgi:hypothetical protein
MVPARMRGQTHPRARLAVTISTVKRLGCVAQVGRLLAPTKTTLLRPAFEEPLAPGASPGEEAKEAVDTKGLVGTISRPAVSTNTTLPSPDGP